MDKFQKGDTAIIIGTISHPEHIGRECEVVRVGLVSLEGVDRDYEIRVDGVVSSAQSGTWAIDGHNLRKKNPPEEPATWQEIQQLTNWNPTKEVAL